MNPLQSLIETTSCSLCMGTCEVPKFIYLPEDTTLTMWVPCLCVMPEELSNGK